MKLGKLPLVKFDYVNSGEMNSVITSSNDTYRWQPDGLFPMT
jgi:hypothetical protein